MLRKWISQPSSVCLQNLLVLSRECGNELRLSCQGSHQVDSFSSVIPIIIACISCTSKNSVFLVVSQADGRPMSIGPFDQPSCLQPLLRTSLWHSPKKNLPPQAAGRQGIAPVCLGSRCASARLARGPRKPRPFLHFRFPLIPRTQIVGEARPCRPSKTKRNKLLVACYSGFPGVHWVCSSTLGENMQ